MVLLCRFMSLTSGTQFWSFAPFCPSQWHWQEMISDTENESTPSDNNLLRLRSKVSVVTGGVRVCVFEMCMKPVSDQLSAVDSLSDWCICVSNSVVCQASVTVHVWVQICLFLRPLGFSLKSRMTSFKNDCLKRTVRPLTGKPPPWSGCPFFLHLLGCMCKPS